MNEIAVRPVPPRQRYITSILQHFSEMLKVRTTALACAEGYPVGSALVGYVRAYLAVPTVKQLKVNLMSLRDILRFAASVIETMPSLRVDKYQLSFADVTNYMSLHKTAYGFAHLTASDITLASYLVTSSEDDAENWLAEFDASASGNLISIIDSLYRDAGSLGLTAKSYADVIVSIVLRSQTSQASISESFSAFKNRFKDTDIYSPSLDAIIPLGQYDPTSFSKTETLLSKIATRAAKARSKAAEAGELSSESELKDLTSVETLPLIDDFGDSILTTSLLALADLRMVDHVATFLMDETAWSTFITNRPKPDPSSNLERAKGLSRLAGLIHSLLMYPHVLKSRMLMASYDSMSGFIGIMPSLPSDLVQNYEKYVIPFDVLGCGQDASNILESLKYKNKRGDSAAEILQGFPIELLSSVSVLSRLNSLPSAVPPISALAMTSLTSITRNVTYDEIIAAVPIQRVAYISDITAFLATSNVFQNNIRSTIATISGGYSDVYQKEIESFLATASFTPWVSMAVSPAETFSVNSSSAPFVSNGLLQGIDNSPFSTAYLQRLRQTAEVGYFFTVRNYVTPRRRPFPSFPRYAVIEDYIARWQDLVPSSWKALYPATAFNGAEIIDVDTLTSQSFELDLLLEKLSGSHIAIFRRYLENSATIKNWATVMSSSCLLFDCGDEEPLLIEGWGQPYGVTYSTLRSLNLSQPLLRINETRFSVMFLRNLPVPTDEIAPLTNVPYPRYGMMVKGQGSVDVSAPIPSYAAYEPNKEMSYESLFFSAASIKEKADNGENSNSSARLLYVIARPYQHMALINVEIQESPVPAFTFDARHAYRLDGLALHLDPLEILPEANKRVISSINLSHRSEVGNMLKLAPGLRVTKLGSYLPSGTISTAASTSTEAEDIKKVIKDMEKQMDELSKADQDAASANVVTMAKGANLQDKVVAEATKTK